MAESSVSNEFPQPQPQPQEDAGMLVLSKPIGVLDRWENDWSTGVFVHREYKEITAVLADNSLIVDPDIPDKLVADKSLIVAPDIPDKKFLNYFKKCPRLYGRELRKVRPNYIPVDVEKDFRSDFPQIYPNKYHVHGEMPLSEFLEFIRRCIGHCGTLFFNIKDPEIELELGAGPLISEISKGYIFEDGFLPITYRGVATSGGRGSGRDRIVKRKPSREEMLEEGCYTFAHPICDLEYSKGMECFEDFGDIETQPRPIDALHLRETLPDWIPVSVEKDARSDIPDIDVKKYHVHGDTPLGELEFLIRAVIGFGRHEPLFFYVKNTETEPLTADTAMFAIDEENKDEDGYLHVTYSGEERSETESENAVKNRKKRSYSGGGEEMDGGSKKFVCCGSSA